MATQRSSLPLLTLLACMAGCGPSSAASPAAAAPSGSSGVRHRGLEGFYDLDGVDDDWLMERGTELRVHPLRNVRSRLGKLVIDEGERTIDAAELRSLEARYCEPAGTRPFNGALCDALSEKRCVAGSCSYRHFGNCSGFFFGDGIFLTAAHCVDGVARDPAARARSQILRLGQPGALPQPVSIDGVLLGKDDFDHQWVALGDRQPVDVAAILVDDGGLSRWPHQGQPAVGEPLFVPGFPRSERRSRAAMDRHGYGPVFGTPSVSFGRVVDPNLVDSPLCSVDGRQEHWALQGDCAPGRVSVDGSEAHRGVIARHVFLGSADTIDGLSGAPVFDARGHLVGVNSTALSDHDPAEAYDGLRSVATHVDQALLRLRLMPLSLEPIQTVGTLGTMSDAWARLIAAQHSDEDLAQMRRTVKPLSDEERAWHGAIVAALPGWRRRAPFLAVPFVGVEAPRRLRLLFGNRGGQDGFTDGSGDLGFDLSAWVAAYGPPTEAGSRARVERILDHEYTHVLVHGLWRQRQPRLETALDRALATCFNEGLGHYRSLSERWLDARGRPTELATQALSRLAPTLVERLEALARAQSPDEETALREGLATGAFDQKWGALPVALWLAAEAGGDERQLRPWVLAGPDAVVGLAVRHLPAGLAARLRALDRSSAAPEDGAY